MVISLQGLGDLLLITPLLSGLKKSFPRSQVTVLTLKANEGILDGNGDVDKVFGFNPRDKNNILKVMGLICRIRKEQFDLTICTYPSGLRSAVIAYLSGAKERLGQNLNLFRRFRWLFTRLVPVTSIKHAVLMNMDFLVILGFNTNHFSTGLTLQVGPEDIIYAEKFLRCNDVSESDTVIAVHAGGGEFTAAYRSWPLDRFAKTADELADKYGAKIVFIGGKGDKAAVNKVAGMMKNKSIIAAGKMSLKQTAGLLMKARLLLCNNSGPMHIAAALNMRTVSIFGSADPEIHRPWGSGHIVLRSSSECAPCYYPFFRDTLKETGFRNSWIGRRFVCKAGDYRCLTDITTDQAVEAASRIINGTK